MKIGVPKEIKSHEYRVGLVPDSVRELTGRGHEVYVQSTAGDGIQAYDHLFEAAGATIIDSASDVFNTADMIVKVKEPQKSEYEMLKEGQMLFTYLHLAPDPEQAAGLVKSGAVAIAYETVTDDQGRLPLLTPMSEVAGRMSVQVGAYYLQKPNGGSGKLLSGVAGTNPAKVLILGGGVSGFNAARMAVGLEGDVTVLEKNSERRAWLDDRFKGKAEIIDSDNHNISRLIKSADLIIGAVLVPGGAAPKLVTKDMLSGIRDGSVMVDIAIDQGGCFETSRPTSHDAPIFVVDGVTHYCVANMPGAVPYTSAHALNRVILPYVAALADKGWKQALSEDSNFKKGLNVCLGKVTHQEVAHDLSYDFVSPDNFLK